MNKPAPAFVFSFLTRSLLAGLALALFTGLAACRREEVITVKLQGRTPQANDLRRFEIRAQIAGAQTGLRYKWLADYGECDPQESEWPATIFRFADNTVRDRVTAEVWRGDHRLALEHIDLSVAAQRSVAAHPQVAPVAVEITAVPAFDPHGGPNTHADIAGKVTGTIESDYRIVIYARADEAWYIQPSPYISHAIHPDRTWSTWTHTGSNYAALVVRTGFTPMVICDVLPQIGNNVLARTIVEGTKQP